MNESKENPFKPSDRYFLQRWEPDCGEWWETGDAFSTKDSDAAVRSADFRAAYTPDNILPITNEKTFRRYRVVKETITWEVVHEVDGNEQSASKS